MNTVKKYLWLIPALYVAYMFGGKVFEVLADSQEFTDIISVVIPVHSIANLLAYGIGIFDFVVALSLLTFSAFAITRKYHRYVFWWTIVWPFVPSSIRYFGGVSEFEIVEVLSISAAACLAYLLWARYSNRAEI